VKVSGNAWCVSAFPNTCIIELIILWCALCYLLDLSPNQKIDKCIMKCLEFEERGLRMFLPDQYEMLW
jgi:hypothetical protein